MEIKYLSITIWVIKITRLNPGGVPPGNGGVPQNGGRVFTTRLTV